MFVDDMAKGFQEDGMKDGRLIFLVGEDGSADIVFRDASGSYLSASGDGGDVRFLGAASEGAESWVVAYRGTGVTETHNITRTLDGRLVDLWTSNKPPTLIGASAKVFVAECVRL